MRVILLLGSTMLSIEKQIVCQHLMNQQNRRGMAKPFNTVAEFVSNSRAEWIGAQNEIDLNLFTRY